MKNVFSLLIFYSSIVFSQTTNDFLIKDNEKIFTNIYLSDIILESKNYAFNLVRDEKQNFIFKEGGFNYVLIEKQIDPYNTDIFPNYSVGYIYKKYFFLKEDFNDKCIIWKVDTKIILSEYKMVSSTQINNCFNKLKNEIVKNIEYNNWFLLNNSNKINNKIWNDYYDIIEEAMITKKSKFNGIDMVHYFLNGRSYNNSTTNIGSNLITHIFYFSFSDEKFLNAEKNFQEIDSLFIQNKN